MSRVPYLDHLGDEIERAVTESAPRRQLRGGTVLAIAFVMVLLAGASLWVLRDGRDPDVAETSTTTTIVPENLDSIEAPNVPQTWARVPHSPALGSGLRTTFSGITTTDTGFAAVGTATANDEASSPTGLIAVSADGIEWSGLIEIPGINLNDIAAGATGIVAAGMRDFRPVVATSDGTVADLPILAGSGERAISASAIAATDTGYVAVGNELEANDEQRQRGSIWWSEDGVSWIAIDSPNLGWYHEASINDVIVESGTVLAVGLVGRESGTSVPTAWMSSDGTEWETIELPAEDATGFTQVSGVAFGHGRYVAVGSRPSVSGGAGTAWVSEDGRNWRQLTDEAVAGVERTATRISAVAPVADGFVAVGHSLERPASRHVIWTADTAASSWTRLDLADPDDNVSTSAFGIAINATRVVVTGATFDITYSEASGAVWVGPAPASLETSVPITTAPPEETERVDDERSLEINPERAVAGTSVRVVGRLPDGHGLDEVLVQLESNGTTIDFCRAVAQGRNFMCRATIADLTPQPDPGTYSVVAAGIPIPQRRSRSRSCPRDLRSSSWMASTHLHTDRWSSR